MAGQEARRQAGQDLRVKLDRLAALMDARGAASLRIARGGNLAWLTGGGDFLVYQRGGPVAEAVVQGGALTLVTNDIEAQRLRDEELPEGVTVLAHPWYDGAEKDAIMRRLTGDAPVTDDELDLYPARTPLLESERASFASLGEEAARTMTDALMALEPGLSERQVAARVRAAFEGRGLACPVLLVAGQGRLGRYRHPIPTAAPFGAVGLVVVCAERRGLILSLSRMVAFGEAPAENRERLLRVLEVERAMWDVTRPGTPVSAVLAAAQEAYGRAGYPDAWQEHHQGGPVGYFPRDFLATPDEARPVLEGVVYAWNPSLPHAKAEDSILVSEDGLVNLSYDPRWPSLEVGGRARPDILIL